MDARRRMVATLAGLSLLAGLAAGCGPERTGGTGPTESAAPPSASAAPVTSAPVPTPAGTRTPGATTGGPKPSPDQGTVVLRGTMAEGVEGGCWVLQADNGKGYQLIGLDPDLERDGLRLEVHG